MQISLVYLISSHLIDVDLNLCIQISLVHLISSHLIDVDLKLCMQISLGRCCRKDQQLMKKPFTEEMIMIDGGGGAARWPGKHGRRLDRRRSLAWT
jgi:hypothetical protein